MEESDVKRATARVLKKESKREDFGSTTFGDVLKLVAKRLCVDAGKLRTHKAMMKAMMREKYFEIQGRASPAGAPKSKRRKTGEEHVAASPTTAKSDRQKKKKKKKKPDGGPEEEEEEKSKNSSKKKKKRRKVANNDDAGDNGKSKVHEAPTQVVDRSIPVKKLHVGDLPEYAPLFCRECGSLFSIGAEASLQTIVKCQVCSHGVPIESVLKSRIKHNVTENEGAIVKLFPELAHSDKESQSDAESNNTNPLGRARVDEACPECGEARVLYYTRQLRSADEGQTVFYQCEVCNHEWNENT